MGTRHLVGVIVDGEMKVAQYGQWDGYPGGVGVEVLGFCADLDTSEAFENFADKVRGLREYTEEEIAAAYESIKEEGVDGSDELAREYPELSRDTSNGVLRLIADGEVTAVKLMPEFGLDSLFCEWAFVIDLDGKTLDCYEGFNKEEFAKAGYWKGSKGETDGYGPVELVKQYPLDSLPSDEEFIQGLDPDEEEED